MLTIHELFFFITNYGYLAVFFGSILEGESILLVAGLLAYENYLSLPLILLLSLLGSVTGDTFWFVLGRRFGDKLLTRWSWLKKLGDRSTTLVAKKPVLVSFLMRFMYGFRNIVPFSLGRTNLRFQTFLFFNFLGALAWVTVFSLVGYLFGGILTLVFGRLRRYELLLIIFVIFLLFAFNFILQPVKSLLWRSSRRDCLSDLDQTLNKE